MSKITSYSADYQTFPALFELEPVAGKKVTVDFSAPELSSLGGLPLVRNMKSVAFARLCWIPSVLLSVARSCRSLIYK